MRNLLALLLVLPSLCFAQLPDYVPTGGLVAWYPLDGDVDDAGANDFHMENNGATFGQDWQGEDNMALSLIEPGDYCSLPTELMLQDAEGLTFSWRAKSLNWSSPEQQYLMDISDGICDNCWAHRYSLSLGHGYDNLNKVSWNAEGAAGTSWGVHWIVPESEQNGWIHAVGTVDMTTQTASLYINGQFISQESIVAMEDFVNLSAGNDQSKIIGRRSSLIPSSREFTGFVDNIGIWNRALTAEEILTLYNEEPATSGCSDPEACNYDAEASVDDGSCIPSGCLDETACNFNAEAGCSGEECEYDTGLLDCSTFGFEADSLLACMGAEIEVNAPEVIYAPPGSGSAEFIASFYLDFGGPSEYSLGPQAAGQYEFTVSGTYCNGSCWNGHTRDAAYIFNSPWHNDINPLGGNSFTINEYCPQDDNSCALIRPEPDEYNPDHVYTYFYDHSGGDLVVYGLADECCWGDNQAGLDFSVSRLPASPCALDYAWSTGATSASITTQPVASSYVTVTVSSSVETCTDSLWIEVIDFGCSDPDACNYDASDLCSADCIYPLLGASDCEEGGLACGAGTIWDHALQQCVAIELVPDTIVIEPEACAPSCGEGTVWDPVNEECIIAIPADLNYDGCVTVNDLLLLLAVHGTCPPYPEWPDEPADTTWTCGDPLTYWDYDYATVLIGDQCWFAENLRSATYANGDSIPAGLSDAEWISTTAGATAVYGEGNSNCTQASPVMDPCDEGASLAAFGRLYNWFAADDSRNICPTHWHVPTDSDWMDLEVSTGMDSVDANNTGWRGTDEGLKLKSSIGWNNGGNGQDVLGFNVQPAGGRHPLEGRFLAAGDGGYFWTSTPDGTSAWIRRFKSDYAQIDRWPYNLRNGYSVRCVKD